MRGRTIFDDPRVPGPERRRPDITPGRQRPATAQERERRERRPRPVEKERPLTFRERSERAFVDVGIYRIVPSGELADAHFDGRKVTARRAVNAWIREGLAKESTIMDGNGGEFTLLTLTRKGASVAQDVAAGRGLDPEQKFAAAPDLRREQVAHDSVLYRAARREGERLARKGARVRRVRLEGDLRGTVSRRCLAARYRHGQRAADAERHRAADELGLPVDREGSVLYPDLQIEYVDAEGRTGSVNIEIATGTYRTSGVRSKAGAGFRMHARGPGGERVLARARSTGPGR